MKLFICIYFIVSVIEPCARAKSFNFGNFFLGSSKKALDSSEAAIPRAAPQKNLFDDSDLLDYSTETDSDVFNSSSDDFNDFDYQNSSTDNLEVSNRNELNNPPPAAFDNTTVEKVVAESQDNETHSSDEQETTESDASTVTGDETTTLIDVPSAANASRKTPSVGPGEQEEVVLGTTTGATDVLIPKNFFQKSIDWVEDTYTLSILIPIAAGILFATTIIVTVAVCRCLRRCCRRKRFKRKPLPDSVKNLTPSDRARLLGDTSDEEF